MSIVLPAPIATYFAASNAHDADGCAACFAKEAVVMDEGRERRGLADIRAWKEEVIEKYQMLTDIVDVSAGGVADKYIVTARVSGKFPGSPINLRYGFTLDAEKIARLAIVP